MTSFPTSMTIGGEPVAAERTLEVVDPATGEVFAHVPDGGPEAIDAAVRSAARAFRVWSARPPEDRRKIVAALLDEVADHGAALAALITAEQGKPLDKAASEVQSSLLFSRAFLAHDLAAQLLRDTPAQRVELHHRPLGVVGAITAWNYPLLLALWKVAPALLAGNTVVLKPAPTTPLATLKLGELSRALLPPGVLNVVSGGHDAGARLASHPEVRKIAFTGSSATGRRLMANAAPTLKRLTLELGGQDAGIVLPDADVGAIAPDLFWARCANAGQVCAGLKRLFVPTSRHDEVCDALLAVARGVRVGPGRTAGVQMGPVQNRAQRDRLQAQLDDALARGARVVWRGESPGEPGWFFPITILDRVARGMRVLEEEVFGPVFTVLDYDDVDDAIARANDTDFGLGGSVWGRDVERATALALRLETGSAWVNQHPAMGPDFPFGGLKGSGIGVELGRWGLEAYTGLQVLNIRKS